MDSHGAAPTPVSISATSHRAKWISFVTRNDNGPAEIWGNLLRSFICRLARD